MLCQRNNDEPTIRSTLMRMPHGGWKIRGTDVDLWKELACFSYYELILLP